MVREIRSTKNGHKLIEFEDDTGTIPILFSNKNEEVFKEAEKLKLKMKLSVFLRIKMVIWLSEMKL